MDYVGVAPRVKVDHRVYTANEAPLHLFIDFHHEMSLMKNQPSKIFFCCTIPSSEGGETSIARSWVLLREMEKRLPEFMEKLEGVGFVAELVFPKEDTDQLVVGNTLASVLGTNDLAEAEERAKEKMACSSIELMENGSTKVTFGPLEPIRTLQGKRLWTYNIRGYGQKPQLGDGSPIPPQVSETYMKILNEIGVDIRWHKGDVLLVDNLSTMHARRPGKPPRQILVSICK
ncbi:hypothetical protein IFM89_005723 [Coptis chinensis]|uniref:TauD/TfdA-like domain-containing protein n=1 Tax=Coptis chinensis TaxID=261450 RepID=A0A835IL26_9MAGN|nr:hypothetical protein IFM89_005723 [Coptis chinensis]